MKEVLKSFRWYNWGGMIPGVVFFNLIVGAFGVNTHVGWANVVGWVLCSFQVFCLGLIIRTFLLERRRQKQQDREFERETDELREQYKKKKAEFAEILKEIHLCEQALDIAYRDPKAFASAQRVHQRLDDLKFDACISGEMPVSTYECSQEEEEKPADENKE